MFGILFALLAAAAAAAPVQAEREVVLMGTTCRLTAQGADRAAAFREIERCLQVLETAEAELSTWRRDSLLGRINSAPVGVPFAAGEELCRLFETLAWWQRETASAFDPGIGALLDAWGVHGAARIPSADELDRARSLSGMSHFVVDRPRAAVTRGGDARIDSGAFGKGEALDRALRSRPAAAGPWLIDLGGQLIASGPPAGRGGWAVALADPRDRTRPMLQLGLADGSLATSCGSERDQRVAGLRVGHILDPRTGRPAPFDGSVTVWHPSALVADILSTALYVMGPERGRAWAETRGFAACFAVPRAGSIEIRATRPFRRRFSGLAPEPQVLTPRSRP